MSTRNSYKNFTKQVIYVVNLSECNQENVRQNFTSFRTNFVYTVIIKCE